VITLPQKYNFQTKIPKILSNLTEEAVKSTSHKIDSEELQELKSFFKTELQASETRIKTEFRDIKEATKTIVILEKRIKTFEDIDWRYNVIVFRLKPDARKTPSDRKTIILNLANKLGLKSIDLDNAYQIKIKSIKPGNHRPMIIKLIRLIETINTEP